MSGTTSSGNLSDIYGYPVLDTWVNGQPITVDWLNRNIRDPQAFLAYAPTTTVQRAATQSLANGANTAVTFDTEAVDTDNLITVPSTNLTIARPGIYEVQTCAFFQPSSAGAIRALHIDLNGAHTSSINSSPSSSSNTTLTCGAVLALNKGDIITQICFQNSGGALTVGGDLRHRLTIRLLSTAATTLTFDPTTGGSTSSGATGGTSTPPTTHTPTKHVSSFSATFSRTFDGDGTITWDDSPYCYQGYYDGNRGNTRSIVGFNAASIRSTLAGATKITGTFTFKVAHSYWNSGMIAEIGTHKYASKPSTWSSANVYEEQMSKGSCAAGHTYTIALSSWMCWAFQNNVIQGMAFGPGPSTSRNYYGYSYGATQGGKPVLTFTYYK